MADQFPKAWANARRLGIRKADLAKDLEIKRYRLDDLTSGRARPTLGEVAKLGHRGTYLVVWEDADGRTRAFQVKTGRHMGTVLEDEESLYAGADAEADAMDYPPPSGKIRRVIPGWRGRKPTTPSYGPPIFEIKRPRRR